MTTRRTFYLMILSWLVLVSAPAQSELNIRITEGADSAIPVAVVPFANPDNLFLSDNVAEIVRNDLVMSGDFASLSPTKMLSLPSRGGEVYYRDWRLLEQQYLLVGELRSAGQDRVQLRFELFDVNRQERILGEQSTVSTDKLRSLGHYVSDKVYEAVTGIKGAFSTRLAYITENQVLSEPVYRLHTSDFDGRNSQVRLKSSEPILSPDWSPDGSKLAYVSFETGRPAIYVHELASGEREKIASFPGLNSAPSWSPDGQSLLVTLSKDGNAEIYKLDLATKRTERLTDHWAIDTEASWSPDGRRLVFTSDRSGGPQIYMMSLDDREPRRLTFEGRYNARPRFSPDGKTLYFVHQRDGDFHTAKLDLASGELSVLTRTALDESPDVAPNGRMLIYATGRGKNSVLAVVSSNGGSKYTLPAKEGEVKEPAWSPFLN
jgi:TolB protein